MALTAGTSKTAITPPVGIPLSGFVGRGVAMDVHDELWATALVLADDASGEDSRHAIVGLDLIGLYSDALVRSLKASVQAATGIHPDRVHLSCSHTHYGPVVAETGDMPGGQHPLAAAYREQLAAAVGACVRDADAARVAVTVSAGHESVVLGVNRRLPLPGGSIALAPNPDGHVDPELRVVRFDTAGAGASQPVATIVSYACHPSSLESTVRSVSADFPGVLRDELERETGARVLFLQGAAGDIDPPQKQPDWKRPQAIGSALAAAAVRARERAVMMLDAPLAGRRARVSLPRRGAASVGEAEAELDALRAVRDRVDPGDPARWWRELKVSEAEAVAAAWREGRAPTIDAEVSAVRVGDIALAFVPCELFSELGVAITQRSPAAVTVVAGYTDGALWYVPTRSAFDEGGYEVVDACRVAPGAGEELVDRVVDLVRDLF